MTDVQHHTKHDMFVTRTNMDTSAPRSSHGFIANWWKWVRPWKNRRGCGGKIGHKKLYLPNRHVLARIEGSNAVYLEVKCKCIFLMKERLMRTWQQWRTP